MRRPRPPTAVPPAAPRALVALGAALMVISLVRTPTQMVGNSGLLGVFAAYALVIAVGEFFRFRVEDGREMAPMSLAAALALALSSGSENLDLSTVAPAPILLTVAVGMVLGSLAHLARGRRVRLTELAARYVGVVVTAVVYRRVPVWQGRTLLELDAGWRGDRWPIAVLMSLVAVVGLLVFLSCSALVTAARLHRDLGRALVDELRAGAGLSLALSATGTLIALASRPIGLAAPPLFLIPLVLTQFALRQYAAIRDTYAQTVRVLSRITELGGYTRAGHPERVASLAVEMGRDLGLTDRETRHLEYAALLHDIGQLALRAPIPAGATVMAAPADQRRIAADSAAIVGETGAAPEVSEAVEQQATPFRVVRELDEELSLLSRIVKVANAYDDFVGGSITPRRREAAIERIHLGLGYEYDPRVVDALVRVLQRRRG